MYSGVAVTSGSLVTSTGQAMGVDFVITVASEKKDSCIAFIVQNYQQHVSHLFRTVEEHVAGKGYCFMCKKFHEIGSKIAHMLICSPSCQPFSELRWTEGGTVGTSSSVKHPLYGVSMSLVSDCHRARGTPYWLLEEVDTFRKPPKGKTQSPAAELTEQLQEEGENKLAAVDIVQLNGGTWIEGSRIRR